MQWDEVDVADGGRIKGVQYGGGVCVYGVQRQPLLGWQMRGDGGK